MSEPVQEALEALRAMTLDSLRAEWRRRYGRPPMLRSAEFFRLMLAWRIQASATGGLDPQTSKALRRKGAVEAEGLHLGVGATLQRHWQDRNVVVTVTEAGFEFEGRTFRSLSAAATAIAGTKWNGPRFFGLRP